VKEYMRIREYCKESGFPEKTLRRLCKTHMAPRFSRRTGDCVNSHILINPKRFQKLWDEGAFRNCI